MTEFQLPSDELKSLVPPWIHESRILLVDKQIFGRAIDEDRTNFTYVVTWEEEDDGETSSASNLSLGSTVEEEQKKKVAVSIEILETDESGKAKKTILDLREESGRKMADVLQENLMDKDKSGKVFIVRGMWHSKATERDLQQTVDNLFAQPGTVITIDNRKL